ncbi:NUDIX domain-containing protein [Candidatus Parcubacteria bacterium]|nr:NUDIX domain-containing protein [Candidatus Parcubacteria bacterium]
MPRKQKITRVGFFLYDPNKKLVLVHKRDDKRDISSPNKWDYFGGSLESADLDDPNHALERELYEELGVSVEQKCIKVLAHNKNEKMHYIIYPKYKTREFRFDEGAGFAWLSFKEALSLFNKGDDTKSFITKEANGYLLRFRSKLRRQRKTK